MALTRKQWNNIIIAASVFMVAILSLLQHKTGQMPEAAQALFDDATPLSQLQLDGIWLQKRNHNWDCDNIVLNCHEWANAWRNITISAVAGTPTTDSTPQEVVIQVEGVQESQVWLYFASNGLLKSSAGNWYQIPPSLRPALQPILDANSD